jgi:hypothetical protein
MNDLVLPEGQLELGAAAESTKGLGCYCTVHNNVKLFGGLVCAKVRRSGTSCAVPLCCYWTVAPRAAFPRRLRLRIPVCNSVTASCQCG